MTSIDWLKKVKVEDSRSDTDRIAISDMFYFILFYCFYFSGGNTRSKFCVLANSMDYVREKFRPLLWIICGYRASFRV